jgi:PKD repeat protein
MTILTRIGVTVAVASVVWAAGAGAEFSQQGNKLIGNDATGAAWQASAVAVSGDGNTAIVGGYLDNGDAGATWVFTRSAGVWTQQGPKLIGSGAVGDAGQGWSVALSADGNTAIIGGPGDNTGAGAAWVFTRSGGQWTQTGAKLVGTGAVAKANHGWAVALSSDGNTAAVGGPGDNNGVGAVWVFTRAAGAWKQQGLKLVGTGAAGLPGQGTSVALSGDASTLVAGGPQDNKGSGAVWVFSQSAGAWTQQGNKLAGLTPTSIFSIQGNAEVTANFTQQSPPCVALATAVAPVADGTIVVNTPPTCTGGYLPGTRVSLSLTPTTGWTLAGWSGSGGSFSNVAAYDTTFTIAASATVTANLLEQTTACDTLALDVSPAGAGSVTTDTLQNCTGGYMQGSQAVLAASPAFGWTFVGWSSSGGSFSTTSSPTTTFTIAGSTTVTANFTQSSVGCGSLAVSANPSGAGSVTSGTAPNCNLGFTVGTPIPLTANPAPGWTFAGWSGTGGVFDDPTGLATGARQGTSVSLSADGNTAVVSGYATGGTSTVWVFARAGGTWIQQGNPLPAGGEASLAQQAWSVAISGDGNTILASEPGDDDGTGAAWVFARTGGVWTQQGGKLVGTGASGRAEQGSAAALSADGSTAVVGGPDDNAGAGAAWVFVAGGANSTCTFALAPALQRFPPMGGTGALAVEVASGTGCSWVAFSNDPWITVASGEGGTGDGRVSYAVSTNLGATRIGTLTVGGQTFEVDEAGSECSYTLTPGGADFPENGGAGSLGVGTSTQCPWAAATTASWLHLTSDTGQGQGQVAFTVDANTGPARAGAIAVGSAAFTVNQAGYVPPPEAGFSVAPGQAVAGEVLQFSDTSAGAPTSWSWAFGDGAGSLAQSPTHTYAAAGTYTVVLTVADAGGQSSVSRQLVVGSGSEVWVPVVSHVSGVGGTAWRSDVGLLNPGGVDATVQGLLTGPAGLVTGTVVVPAGSQLVVGDVVAQLGSSGSGALEILSDQPLVVTSRTYDQLASGTVGGGYASYGTASGLANGMSAWLPQLAENADYRTNISLTNTGSVAAAVTVALFDGTGNPLGSYDVALAPGAWAQENQPFFSRAGQTSMDAGYAKVTVTAGAGVIASASVIDNVTDDPTTVAMVP